MNLKVTGKDALSWLAHSAGMLVIIGIIGGFGYGTDFQIVFYAAGYAFGLSVYFQKEAKENRTIEIWKWKTLDSVLDFVLPAIAGGAALRYVIDYV